MNDKTFDPTSFMQSTVDSVGDTEYVLCPIGEYPAVIDDFDEKAFRQFDRKEKGTDNIIGATTVFSPGFAIQDPQVLKNLERDKLVVYHKGIFLDVDDNGGFDMGKGKNVQLNQLRDAVGQNVPGWNIMMLRGAGPLVVRVDHEAEKKDGVETGRKFARVTRVAKIS